MVLCLKDSFAEAWTFVVRAQWAVITEQRVKPKVLFFQRAVSSDHWTESETESIIFSESSEPCYY